VGIGKKRALLLLGVAATAAVPAMALAQRGEYPITVVAPGKGPYTFPEGYQTPWDRIEIMVTEKMSPNLFVLHGSEGLDPAHPDASGGRAMALFGPDGVLMVDTENRQVAEKTLKAIRSFTNAPIKVLVNTWPRSVCRGRLQDQRDQQERTFSRQSTFGLAGPLFPQACRKLCH